MWNQVLRVPEEPASVFLETLTFPHPPFGMVTFKAGQLGYRRKTRVRLRVGKQGIIWFPVRGRRRYLLDPHNNCVFKLVPPRA